MNLLEQNSKKIIESRKKIRLRIGVGGKVLVLAKRLKKKDAPGKF